jgi:hypothetical protein
VKICAASGPFLWQQVAVVSAAGHGDQPVHFDSTEDPLNAPRPRAEHARHFPNLAGYRQTATGHNVPHQDPAGFADAIRALHRP